MSFLVSSALASTAASAAEHTAEHTEAFYASPEFWVSVAFVIVVVAFAKPIGGFVKKATATRAEKISAKIDEARRLKDEASAMLSEYETKFKDADTEAAAIIAKAKENAQRLKAEATEKMNLDLAKKEQSAFAKIKSAEAGASDEIRDFAINDGTAVTIKLLLGKLKDKVTAKMLASALKELPDNLKKLA